VSPDGRHVVFLAALQNVHSLWVRPVATPTSRSIPGTEGASFPFWSPDSRFIGFFAGGKLKKVQVSGGPPIVLCDAANGRGGTWNSDNVILFAPAATGTLLRVAAAGAFRRRRRRWTKPTERPTTGFRPSCRMGATSSTPPSPAPADLLRSRH
jgi:hypothetical protein